MFKSILERMIILSLNERITGGSLIETSNRTQDVLHRSGISPKPDVNKFINHLIDLVLKEKSIEQESIRSKLRGAPQKLEEKGVAINNLFVTGKLYSPLLNSTKSNLRCLLCYTYIDVSEDIAKNW
jgi:hypothetical protein